LPHFQVFIIDINNCQHSVHQSKNQHYYEHIVISISACTVYQWESNSRRNMVVGNVQ